MKSICWASKPECGKQKRIRQFSRDSRELKKILEILEIPPANWPLLQWPLCLCPTFGVRPAGLVRDPYARQGGVLNTRYLWRNLPYPFFPWFGREKPIKEKSHKGIWWSECPGSVPGINLGRPRDTRDVWADWCGQFQFKGQNVRGTDGTYGGTDGTFPRDRRDTHQGVSRQNSLCLLVFFFPHWSFWEPRKRLENFNSLSVLFLVRAGPLGNMQDILKKVLSWMSKKADVASPKAQQAWRSLSFVRDAENDTVSKICILEGGWGEGKIYGKLSKNVFFLGISMTVEFGNFANFIVRSFVVIWEALSFGCPRRGRTLREDVFLPLKHLLRNLSAFYKTLPSKNPSKNLVFTENP